MLRKDKACCLTVGLAINWRNVASFSFIKAWLKFRAPGFTLPIDLGIGKFVFTALNKIEWVYAVVISISLWLIKDGIGKKELNWFVLPFIILILHPREPSAVFLADRNILSDQPFNAFSAPFNFIVQLLSGPLYFDTLLTDKTLKIL